MEAHECPFQYGTKGTRCVGVDVLDFSSPSEASQRLFDSLALTLFGRNSDSLIENGVSEQMLQQLNDELSVLPGVLGALLHQDVI